MCERSVDVQAGMRRDPAARVYAVIVPSDDAVGPMRTGDAVVAPRFFKTPQTVRPHPCLRIDAFAQARCQRDDLAADAAGAMFEDRLLRFDLVWAQLRRGRLLPGTILLRAASP